MYLDRRACTPEILDGREFTRKELERNLADIRLYNRWTGGIRTILRSVSGMTRHLPGGSRLSILDVGAGSGDVAAAVRARAAREGLAPGVVAVDLSSRVLSEARTLAGRKSPHGLRLCLADARSLPFRDGAFDVALSSLVMHHLDEEAVGLALAEMRRVTRLGFVVLDLRRSALALASVWALTRLTTRSRLTLHDAPLSVRRALTPDEMGTAALGAGLRGLGRGNGAEGRGEGGFEIHRNGLARLILTYAHPHPGSAPREAAGREGAP